MSVTIGTSGPGFAARGRPAASAAGTMIVLAAIGAAATGCKTGTAMSAPSWFSFNGSATKDSDKLASAPKFDGDTRKPSETAKAYPTTSTPNSYVINGGDAATPGAVATQQPAAPQAVVYGQTPPPAAPLAAASSAAPVATPNEPAGGPGRVAAQVGPYAALAGDQIPPAGQPLPSIGPVTSSPAAFAGAAGGGSQADRFPAVRPGESQLPGAAYSASAPPPMGDQPVSRMADARSVPDVRGSQPPAFAGAAAEASGSRYSAAGASRFSGGSPEDSYPSAAASGGFGTPPEPFTAAPAGQVAPASSPVAPATPALLPSSAPAAVQPGGSPSGQPMRRPDPGYRPFGTSSYRPAQQLLANELPGPTPVRTASYEEAASPVR